MNTIDTINADIRQLHLVKSMATVYGGLAAAKVAQIREGILASRLYLEEMHILANQVYAASHKDTARDKGFATKNLLPQNGKTLRIILGSQTRLYGELVKQVFDFFSEAYLPQSDDVMISGAVTNQLFSDRFPNQQAATLELSDYRFTPEDVVPLVAQAKNYEHIYVYYGKYQNPFNQKAAVFVLSDAANSPEKQAHPVKFIFEPNLDALIAYIEQEIISTLFIQILGESLLAKQASRLKATDRMFEATKDRLAETNQSLRLATHQLRNKRQGDQMQLIVGRLG